MSFIFSVPTTSKIQNVDWLTTLAVETEAPWSKLAYFSHVTIGAQLMGILSKPSESTVRDARNFE